MHTTLTFCDGILAELLEEEAFGVKLFPCAVYTCKRFMVRGFSLAMVYRFELGGMTGRPHAHVLFDEESYFYHMSTIDWWANAVGFVKETQVHGNGSDYVGSHEALSGEVSGRSGWIVTQQAQRYMGVVAFETLGLQLHDLGERERRMLAGLVSEEKLSEFDHRRRMADRSA